VQECGLTLDALGERVGLSASAVDGGRLTRHRVNAIADRVGFTLHSVPQLAAIDSVGDRPCWPTDLSADQ
jgi:hypothetical protein